MSLFVSHGVRRKLGASGAGKLPVTSFRAARELVAALGLEEGAAELNALSLLEEAVHRVLRAKAGDELVKQTARAVEEDLGSRLHHTLSRGATPAEGAGRHVSTSSKHLKIKSKMYAKT